MMSKLAKEIAREAAEYNGIVGIGAYVLGLEPIIAAKLEPVREALTRAHNAESAKDMWDDVGRALALLSEEE